MQSQLGFPLSCLFVNRFLREQIFEVLTTLDFRTPSKW